MHTPLMPISVREAGTPDFPAIAVMRHDLWPEGPVEEHLGELPGWLADPDTCSLVAVDPDGRLIGFLEGRLRSHADGCGTSPVAYLEGWYVEEAWRQRGVGRALFVAFEEWARSRGCQELASDTWPENDTSIRAHRRLGFEEVDRVVTFRKALDQRIPVPAAARAPARWDGD